MKNPGYYSIIEFREGNKEAFKAIYNTHYAQLYYFVKRIIDDTGESEDIVAETFIKLWNIRERFETPQNIKAFLFITAKNACLDYLRSIQRQNSNQQAFQYVLLQDTDFTFVHDEIKIEVLGRVYAEIENLPPKCKQVFKMAYFKGLKNEEIARLLNLSYQTVKNQKLKAVKLIRIALVNVELVLMAILFWGCNYWFV